MSRFLKYLTLAILFAGFTFVAIDNSQLAATTDRTATVLAELGE